MLNTLCLFQKIALVGGLVHPMVPGAKPEVATILVDHGLIEAVGAKLEVPADAKVIHLEGKHVMPGLVDAMVNFDPDHDWLYLTSGVTLVREIGADLDMLLAERSGDARGRNPGPSLWIAGAILDGAQPATRSAVVMTTREEAVDKASRLLHPADGIEGIDYLSFYRGLSKDCWNAVIELAHKESPRRQVWGTLPVGATLEDALKAGQDGVFYLDALLPAGKQWKDLTPEEIEAIGARVGESHLAVTPTLALYASRLLPPPKKPPELKYLGPIQVAQWLADDAQRRQFFTAKPERQAEGFAELKQRLALVKSLYAHKVALVPGSSCGMAPWVMPGEALLDELSLWIGQSVGIPLPEALRMATRASAQRIGADRLHGSLEKGKWANLIVTEKDPEAVLETLHAPAAVMIRGWMFEADVLAKLLENLAQRQQRLQALAFDKSLDQLPALAQPSGELLLTGIVETRYQGQRISAERFAVSRMSDGTLIFAGRSLTFGSATTADTECEVTEKILGGRLVDFELTTTSGPRVITAKGTLSGGTLNVDMRLNGVAQGMPRIRESVAFLECGSVVTDLILGQCVQPGTFTALWMDDFQVNSSDKWALAVDPKTGEHLLQGPIGTRIVSYSAGGAPRSSTREAGRATLARTLLVDTPVEHGTPVVRGLPIAAKQNPK